MKIYLQILCSTFLIMGCTDYQFKNIGQGNEEGTNQESIDSDGSTTSQSDEETEETSSPQQDPIEEDSCSDAFVLFDIEEVSTLQDAVSYSVANWTHDAVVLHFDDTQLTSEQIWRVSSVEILLLISEAHFEYFEDGQELVSSFLTPTIPNLVQP